MTNHIDKAIKERSIPKPSFWKQLGCAQQIPDLMASAELRRNRLGYGAVPGCAFDTHGNRTLHIKSR